MKAQTLRKSPIEHAASLKDEARKIHEGAVSPHADATRKRVAELIDEGFNTDAFLRSPEVYPASSLADCKMMSLRKIEDHRGNLTSIEGGQDIPFAFKRVFYLYDIPGGSARASHAHKSLHQMFISMSGSFDVNLRDGSGEQRYHMNRSYYGLYVPPMIWCGLDNFSSGSVCLALASDHYDEVDYIRNYSEYMIAVAERSGMKQ